MRFGRFPLSLSSRLLLTFVTLSVLGLGSLILVTGTRLAQQSRTQAEQELQAQAQTIANGLRDPFTRSREGQPLEGRSLDALLSSYAQGLDARVTLLDANRKVLLSSDRQVPEHVEEDDPELEHSAPGSPDASIRPDALTSAERVFVAAPVQGSRGETLGYVQLSVPTTSLDAEIRGMWLNLFGIGGIVLLAVVVASILLARQIVSPVEHLTATSEKIAAGQLSERVTPAGPREVRELGVTFNIMAGRVQEMLARQRAFVDNAAHELRTPLTGLSLRLELLQSRGDADPALRREYLQQMARQVAALRRMVDHLLALASAEANQSATRVALDLAPLLYDLADEMGAVAQQESVALEVDVPDHLPAVGANAEQIKIAVRNLLDNAIKYSPEGGRVTLDARREPDAVEIRVADSGKGIPLEALPHIFERFYRVDNGTRWQGGAGLGLALVRSIAESHGGSIAVTSRVGEGSMFTLRLPLAASPVKPGNGTPALS